MVQRENQKGTLGGGNNVVPGQRVGWGGTLTCLGNSPLLLELNLREGKREKMELEQRAEAELKDHRPRIGA